MELLLSPVAVFISVVISGILLHWPELITNHLWHKILQLFNRGWF